MQNQNRVLFDHDGVVIDTNQNVYVQTGDGDGGWYSPPALPPMTVDRTQRLLEAPDHERSRFSRRIKAYLMQIR